MFGKKKKNAWVRRAGILSRKGKLPTDYSALLDYYAAVSWATPSVLHGHYDFFSNARFNGELDGKVKSLRSILPQGLLENFNAALDKFIELGDDPAYDDVISAFDDYDEYADEHCAEMAEILEDFITEMQEKHYF